MAVLEQNQERDSKEITSVEWMNRMDEQTREVISSLLRNKSRESTSRMNVSKKTSNRYLQVSKACVAENKRILALSSVRLPLRIPKEYKRVPSLSSLRCPPLVLSPPRELPAPTLNVICPYCKGKFRGEQGLCNAPEEHLLLHVFSLSLH